MSLVSPSISQGTDGCYVQLIAKAGLAKSDLARCTSVALMEPDRSDKCMHRLLNWLSMNYMQGQIHHSLHLGFVCMQAID